MYVTILILLIFQKTEIHTCRNFLKKFVTFYHVIIKKNRCLKSKHALCIMTYELFAEKMEIIITPTKNDKLITN